MLEKCKAWEISAVVLGKDRVLEAIQMSTVH